MAVEIKGFSFSFADNSALLAFTNILKKQTFESQMSMKKSVPSGSV